MIRLFLLVVAVCSLASGANRAQAEDTRTDAARMEFFERSVRPVLAANCLTCHGAKKQKNGLRLDSRTAVLTGGDSGPAVVPGHPEKSLLIAAVGYNSEPQMPPNGKLAPDQVAALTTWVKMGAPWPDAAPANHSPAATAAFWSFQPVAHPPLPRVHQTTWPKRQLDYFVLAGQEANAVHSVGQADKRTLIRRATFDLTGLPPTPAEIEGFLNDDSAEAFVRVVDRLLASPHYGERWARHWLDVARYGEDQAHTFQSRKYPNGFRYRDWLIRAFNQDLPYDRFVKEQIAADLLDEPGRLDRLAALGFFALGPVYYGDKKMLDQMDDRIDTLTRGFLGLTVACARCHDHKFDPIPQKDYYALAGVFAGTEYEEVPLVPPEVVEAAGRNLTEKEKKEKIPPKYPFLHALKEGAKPVTMRVHLRGSPDSLGEESPRHFLSVLGGKTLTKGSGRLELAEAIASPSNPLTARVMVNRVWQHLFGKGLVRTSNFGALGDPPTYPGLLDHLATRFVRSGWSVKALVREIMLSATYQQASRFDAHNNEADAENRLLWHMVRRRLEVEAWRDAVLAAADRLEQTVGGPSLELALPDNHRRTLYGCVSRHDLNPLLRLFDFPDPNITSGERAVTTVPLQQLFVLNSEFMVGNAKSLAARLAAGQARDNASRIRQAFLLVYGRPVTDRELELGLAFLTAGQARANDTGGTTLTRWEQYAQVLLSANEFMYID